MIHVLNRNKCHTNNPAKLLELQHKIEDLTMNLNERNVFKSTPNMIKLLIRPDLPCAKEILKKKVPPAYLPLLNSFSAYTLEAIMIHVLGLVFNNTREFAVVKVSTLMEQLNRFTRDQARFLNIELPDVILASSQKSKKGRKSSPEGDKIVGAYSIGKHMLEFLSNRGLIDFHDTFDSKLEDGVVVKKKRSRKYEDKLPIYAVCNFDINLLPIKLNLPMISPPMDWQPEEKCCEPKTLTDLRGGYLCTPSGSIYNQFRRHVT